MTDREHLEDEYAALLVRHAELRRVAIHLAEQLAESEETVSFLKGVIGDNNRGDELWSAKRS